MASSNFFFGDLVNICAYTKYYQTSPKVEDLRPFPYFYILPRRCLGKRKVAFGKLFARSCRYSSVCEKSQSVSVGSRVMPTFAKCYGYVFCLLIVSIFIKWGVSCKKCLQTCAKCPNSDHPAYSLSIIRAFTLFSCIL